ncbi:Na+/H+ antiporter [Pseudonocardia bannensis]|uniref:Na+/H+ antiporter n=1 Tax=Pseudonocardia bannensis TaxID=630973 RepID=A0A848DDG7_9PSEU|nr:Na+/H+ antiporter [Pseudonocardia bannensis]NMH90678.1 Na+/H+ antiporter [Pseudonocardia bannensis]
MHTEVITLALVVGSLAVQAICRPLGMNAPLVLVVVGLAASFLPGVTEIEFDPEAVLLLGLTPLLYSAALQSSYLGIRRNIRPISLLAVGLVAFTAVVVGLVAWRIIPGLSLPAALVLGAVVAPPDAVAALGVGRRLGLPKRIMTILGGESLLNDATALTLFRVFVAAAVGAGVTVLDAAWMLAWSTAGGISTGLVVGWLVHRIRMRLNDPHLESAFGLVVPFSVYLIAEQAHTSGLLAVVIAGLYLGYHAPECGFATRIQDEAVWRASDTILESVVFALIGLQLTAVLEQIGAIGPLLFDAVLVTLATVLARPVWVFPITYLPRVLFRGARERDPTPPWQMPAVISWAGMRGVVTVAAAFAIPPEVPQRERLVFLAFFVTVATLLLHGLTLPFVMRRLKVGPEEEYQELLAEAESLYAAAQAGIRRLDELVATEPPDSTTRHIAEKLRHFAELQANSVWEQLGRPDELAGESPSAAWRRLRREMLAAEREVLVRLRSEGRIDDEVLRRALRRLDFEEAMLVEDEDVEDTG